MARLTRATSTLWTAASLLLLSMGCEDPVPPEPPEPATLSGVVRSVSGVAIAGASVEVGDATIVTDAEGQFTFTELVAGPTLMNTSADGFEPLSQFFNLAAGDNTRNATLAPIDLGVWGARASLLEANSEYALAEAGGKLYIMGGYPASRVTARTVQIYDIVSDQWEFGPLLPQPNNHGMAASVGGKIYLIGGQTTDEQEGATAVATVYELDPAVGSWVAKTPMPTARSGGAAVALGGKIYVAGGRVPRGHDFAVYDPATDTWETLPNLPSQRNHIAAVAMNGRVHVVGGRLGNGLSPFKSEAHEVFDPATGTWTVLRPMLRGRSGINAAVAHGCFHVWGGEAPTGMTPDHDYYDPRTNTWHSLRNMPIPVHGVVGAAFVDSLIWVTGGGIAVGGSSGSLHNQTYKPAVTCE